MTWAQVLAGARAWSLTAGDSREVLRRLPDASVDALVTDPPAGVGFAGHAWDAPGATVGARGRSAFVREFSPVFVEALRAMKPGAHAVVWALPRTAHWTMCALEDAGFEIRDVVSHLFATGFPKSLDVAKAIDKRAGIHRGRRGSQVSSDASMGGPNYERSAKGVAATPEAAEWDGWGTALKPAMEFWILARKPCDGPVAANVLSHGTGAINIDACRVGLSKPPGPTPRRVDNGSAFGAFNRADGSTSGFDPTCGRWPAHIVLEHAPGCGSGGCAAECPAAILDAQSGERPATLTGRADAAGAHRNPAVAPRRRVSDHLSAMAEPSGPVYADAGGVARYFTTVEARVYFEPKPPARERAAGVRHLAFQSARGEPRTAAEQRTRPDGGRNYHPTVKPIALMRWLVRLVTPPGGVVLDPFAGSGTTGVAAMAEGARFVGVERSDGSAGGQDYVALARARLATAEGEARAELARMAARAEARAKAASRPATAPAGPGGTMPPPRGRKRAHGAPSAPTGPDTAGAPTRPGTAPALGPFTEPKPRGRKRAHGAPSAAGGG